MSQKQNLIVELLSRFEIDKFAITNNWCLYQLINEIVADQNVDIFWKIFEYVLKAIAYIWI